MGITDKIIGRFSADMGIDLGTANTLVHLSGKGIVLSEPSVVAVHRDSKKVLSVGTDAKQMIGKTPKDIVAVRPMRDGVIADFEIVQKMIRYFIKKIHNRKAFIRPRIAVGVPSGITEVERRAVRESCEEAGVREIYLIEESLAAAIGANLPIQEPEGNMIIDIGGGTTEVSVISLGGMAVSNTIRVGGDKFDEAVMAYVRRNHNLIVGERTSEEIKIRVGNAFPDKKVERMEVRGRDSVTGLPRTLEIDSVEIRECIQEPLNAILEVVRNTLDQTPPELAADIIDKGVVMTGGGAFLKGLSEFLTKETGVPFFLAENPFTCVVMGTGKFLEELRRQGK